MNTVIQHGHKLIKGEIKDIYNDIKDLYKKNTVLLNFLLAKES